jgi:hypothetical protein
MVWIPSRPMITEKGAIIAETYDWNQMPRDIAMMTPLNLIQANQLVNELKELHVPPHLILPIIVDIVNIDDSATIGRAITRIAQMEKNAYLNSTLKRGLP